ncbi:FAD-dependent oxidoreductase [Lentzea sp. NEAU-D7]|uniref:FAD-dependent oxidoreductase n=1 Tax=Lentzea sp. NEAU-D7 TaxID=2994667 RepID=UPI00224A7FDE|nr:FAD-dependent oxidoreductase [Lentzea sp. NEAU-D7]MCX2949034.1 FAD-dependent oxidoreductase [Lentzea sp. NEAU-D7]
MYDVIVVGSGAAGMTAALCTARNGLRTLIIEKAAHYGGSTARSGGGIWVPNNAVVAANGVPDSPEQAATYLEHIAPDVPAELREAFLEAGPAMLAFVCAHTPLKFRWVREYSDYYPEAPGGQPRGRSVEPLPFNAALLGEEVENLEPPYVPTPAGIVITQTDYRWLTLIGRHPRGIFTAAKVFARRFLPGRRLTMGQALTAGLRAGLTALNVEVRLNTAMTDLHHENGRVAGVLAGEKVILAKHVVLASGGFENNEQMRKQHQNIGVEWTVGAKANTGDGIEAGQRAGGAVALMEEAWWGPSVPLPRGPFFLLAERSLPGCVLVDKTGRRFVNEAAPYIDVVNAMTGDTWLVFDHSYRGRYPFCGIPPRRPLPRRWKDTVLTAPSLEELAQEADLPELTETVRRFNTLAVDGRDLDFHRGDSAYDRYYGDPRTRPNPNLAPLTTGPFYAVRIVPGDLGTKGGLRTDARARVLREDGSVIEGLYAAGNTSASVMGHTYAGAGATLGPAMTFGYLAGLDISGGER